MARINSPSHDVLSLLVAIIIAVALAVPSRASGGSSLPSSSRWSPRFLGRFPHVRTKPQPRQPQIRYETRYLDQRLDHFSFSELPSFSQRYLINKEHWVGSQRLGPIFVYCGNEGDIVWFAENTGFVWEIAPQFGAMVVFPEVSAFCLFLFGCPRKCKETIGK